jgi:hypothetical protein
MAERMEKHGFAKQAFDKVCHIVIFYFCYLFFHQFKNDFLTIKLKVV